MFDWVEELVAASAWTYLLVVGFVAVDGFFPVVPGETVVITAAVLAAQGDLSVLIVGAAAFAGSALGDNTSYLLGRELGGRAADRLFRGERSRRRLDWGRRQIHRRPWIITGARFIPGGRTATTFAAGMLGFPWRRFLAYELAGSALWATYATLLGYLGGAAFKDSLWKPLVISFAVAGVVTALGELARRALDRRDRREEERSAQCSASTPDSEPGERRKKSHASTTFPSGSRT